MPKAVILNRAKAAAALPEAPASDLTFEVKLINGTSFHLLDPKRPGNPWVFKNGVAVRVPERIANRLQEKATDNLTMRTGKKTKAVDEQKFEITRIADEPEGSGAQEEEQDPAE